MDAHPAGSAHPVPSSGSSVPPILSSSVPPILSSSRCPHRAPTRLLPSRVVRHGPGRTSTTGTTHTFFPELNEPARPAAARPVISSRSAVHIPDWSGTGISCWRPPGPYKPCDPFTRRHISILVDTPAPAKTGRLPARIHTDRSTPLSCTTRSVKHNFLFSLCKSTLKLSFFYLICEILRNS
jgi:hypothetical protein